MFSKSTAGNTGNVKFIIFFLFLFNWFQNVTIYLVKRRRHFPHSIITHMTGQRHLFWWSLIFAKRKIIIFRSVWSSSLYQGESKFQIYRHLSYLFLERETERINENVYNIDLKLKSRPFFISLKMSQFLFKMRRDVSTSCSLSICCWNKKRSCRTTSEEASLHGRDGECNQGDGVIILFIKSSCCITSPRDEKRNVIHVSLL